MTLKSTYQNHISEKKQQNTKSIVVLGLPIVPANTTVDRHKHKNWEIENSDRQTDMNPNKCGVIRRPLKVSIIL